MFFEDEGSYAVAEKRQLIGDLTLGGPVQVSYGKSKYQALLEAVGKLTFL